MKQNRDIIEWIEKVIQSCKTYEQFRSAERLVHNYERLYGDYHFLGLTLSRQYIKLILK